MGMTFYHFAITVLLKAVQIVSKQAAPLIVISFLSKSAFIFKLIVVSPRVVVKEILGLESDKTASFIASSKALSITLIDSPLKDHWIFNGPKVQESGRAMVGISAAYLGS